MSKQNVSCIERVMSKSTGLNRTMKMKAAVMTGIGGTIGTGLFLSSGDVLATAGPIGAIVLYIIGGFIAWTMTCCLESYLLQCQLLVHSRLMLLSFVVQP